MKKEHDPRVSDFAKYWQNLYQAKHNRDYIFAFKKDYAIIKRLLTQLDAEDQKTSLQRLLTAAKHLFNGDLKWFKGIETIGSFSTHINHLLADDHGGSSRANAVKPTTEQLDAYAAISR